MRRYIIWAVVVIAAALLQTTWLDAFRVLGVTPNLMLLLVVYFGLMEGEERAMLTGVLGGLFQDVAGNNTLGHHILCLVVIGYAVGRISTRLVTDHPAVKAGVVFLASLANGLAFTTIHYIQRPTTPAIETIIERVVPGAFYTALITPILFWLLDIIVGRFLVPQGSTT